MFVINFVPLRTQSSAPIFTWEQDYWLDCSLPLWTPFSPPGRLCLLPNPSLLYPTLCISVCSRRWRTLRELITGWICLSPFHSPLLSSWPPLSPSSLFSSLYNSVNISEWSSCRVHIRKWLLASLLSPPLDSPFSPPGGLYLLPPPSLYPTLWLSLCVPDGREHLGNWLLAGSVSLLLIPPFILLATSVSFLPLLFSSLYKSMNISERSRLWSAHKEVITG